MQRDTTTTVHRHDKAKVGTYPTPTGVEGYVEIAGQRLVLDDADEAERLADALLLLSSKLLRHNCQHGRGAA